MKKTLLIALACSALFTANTNAQAPAQRTCGTTEIVNKLKQTDPGFALKRQQIEDFTTDWIANNPGAEKAGGAIVIPVVVHVLYNTPTENISDAQVQTQIDVLNKDYQRLNTDASNTPSAFLGVAANVGIQFCLATVDPDGNPTTGITRTSTTNTSFNINSDNIKFTSQGGKNAWDRNKYLNLWVGDLGSGLLGYAIPPGGPANTDGVVIHYKYFGTTGTATAPFNKGRTATHEIGHWLNLEHIWGDDGSSCNGSDLVGDTPNQADENYGCPTFPSVSCTNGPNGDMFMNYMDYTDDGCMNMFTAGQKTRMLAALNGPRAALLSSTACSGGGNPNPVTECDTLTNVSSNDNLVVYLATANSAPAGFISGTNTYNDNAKVDKFTTPTGYKLSGGLFLFGRAYTTNNNSKVTAAAWTATGTGGAPGNELVSKDVLINSITEGTITVVNFNTQPAAPTSFYLGIRWTGLANTDSIALYTNSDGETVPNTAWERWSDGTWYAYDDADSWGLALSHAIFPVLCPLVQSTEETAWEGVSVFPNPTDGNLNVYLQLKSVETISMRVLNPMGQLVSSQIVANTTGGTYNFNLNDQPTGLYFVEVSAGNLTKTFKVIVNH